MADAFKSSKGGAQSRRGPDRVALQATLADLARAASDSSMGGSDDSAGRDATPGATGHRALAALAAEVSQASALAEPDTDVSSAPDAPAHLPRTSPVAAALRTPVSRKADRGPAAAPPVVAAGPTPVTAGSLRPIGAARTGSTDPADSAAGETGSLPAPNRLTPASVRLPTKAADTAVAPDQPTIPLRRRALSDGPVSISTTPPTPPTETGSVGADHRVPAAAMPTAGKSTAIRGASPTVVAWLPSDDDILPRRQLRRGRSFRRAR